MRVNNLLKRISAGLLAALTVVSLVPQGGLTFSSTVSAANVASGVEGTLGSVDINGYKTMYDYIKHDFTYTDQMTVNDYKDARSASYDRNETPTGKNSVDYLSQSVEWTDVDNGEALLSVAGKDTTDSVAFYCFQTCIAHGLTPETVRENIKQLASVYDRVDCLCVNGPTFWDEYSTFGHFHGEETKTTGHRKGYAYSTVNLSGDDWCGVNPVFSIRGGEISDQELDKYLQSFTWYAVGHFGNNQMTAIGCYLFGDISCDTWGTGESTENSYTVNTVNNLSYKANIPTSNSKLYDGNLSSRGSQYRNYLMSVANNFSNYTESDIVNMPTAIYVSGDSCVDGSNCLSFEVLPDSDNDGVSDIVYKFNSSVSYSGKTNAYKYMNSYSGYNTVIGHTSSSNAGKIYGSDLGWSYDDTSSFLLPYSMNENLLRIVSKNWCDSSDRRYVFMASKPDAAAPRWSVASADNLALISVFRPDYVCANWDKLWSANQVHPAQNYTVWNSYLKDAGGNVALADYSYNFLQAGVRLPDKQLMLDIPVGDSWQIALNETMEPNIVFTEKYPEGSNKTGYIQTDANGKPLKVNMVVDANNVIHITTNTYVKGAEISIQIPLKYSANGVQSAKQLRTDANGHVYTDGKSGTPVADTYVISMTSGDTKLHVGPDILGDLDTALSIYMPSSDLMDVQVNLHWMNDSDTIKGMLGDTSVRGNATALIGSDALVGNKLGKQSDDDEKAGGIGTSVVAMNFANANGSVGTIASSYTDSDGITKQLSNDSVDLQLRKKNGAPDLWTDAKDEAGENNVVTYMMFNVPRLGHPTTNTYDANGNVTGVTDLANGVVPRYYYVEDVVNVPAGYTAYNVTDMASSDIAKLQKGVGTDSENPMMHNNPLYYAYNVTPPSDWNSSSKLTYKIDCYVALDIKSLKMTVEHYQEQLTGDGYTPSTNKQYKLESSIDSYEAITSVYSPEVKTYAGYDSPDRQSLTVTVTGDHVIKYYYDLHYYDINVDTQGGEWYEEQDDGTWNAISEPPAHYTILTPTFTLPIPDKVGFDFEGYIGTGLSKVTHNVTIEKGTTGDKAYKANWIAQAYDVEVPVSLIFSASYDGVMKGAFDQNGSGKVAKTGFLLNNSEFPVQVTHITYNNDSVYTMSDVKSDEPNIMNWRLDATNGTHTYNAWATALDDTVDVLDEETYWMAQNSEGKVILDSDQAWYRNDVSDIKDTTKIGNIVWMFGIGHRNVVERPIVND